MKIIERWLYLNLITTIYAIQIVNYQLSIINYFDRIASTGSILDAVIAGIIPAITPIATAIDVPINAFFGDNKNPKSVALSAMNITNQTRIKPTTQPMRDKMIASIKNSVSMR